MIDDNLLFLIQTQRKKLSLGLGSLDFDMRDEGTTNTFSAENKQSTKKSLNSSFSGEVNIGLINVTLNIASII